MNAEPATVVVSQPNGGETLAALPATLDRTAFTADGSRQWQVQLTGLEPSSIYCYEVRQGDEVLVGSTGFRTAPDPDEDATARFLVFGDSGEAGNDQIAVLEQMRTVPYELMIHTGDIAYNSGSMQELEETFFAPYLGLLKNFPIFPASGNHDYGTDDAAPFRSAFCLPENGGRSGRERWYSFDWGPVHFSVVDTEKMSDEQAAWLDRDLGATDRPWRVVVGHKPPFSSGFHGNDQGFQSYFVPVIERHKVPLVLNGHDHDYERTHPINGVTYVVTGGGGRGVKGVGVSDFTAFSESVLHFVYATADRATLRLHAIDATGKEFDSLTLTR
jgi:3',5'-cyclic AMP phosphodiesterase CpdA